MLQFLDRVHISIKATSEAQSDWVKGYAREAMFLSGNVPVLSPVYTGIPIRIEINPDSNLPIDCELAINPDYELD